ncbi:MAG: helix-turn-helix domain-containing protein [Rhodobacteraceae bacterium]|nr:helix-turn-helix domain-containing protein [Paracoccaceae bacterium]
MVLDQPLLNTHQVAALLGVKEAAVRVWIGRGDLRAIRLGREYRIAVCDLESFVDLHATRPRLPPEARPNTDKTLENGNWLADHAPI